MEALPQHLHYWHAEEHAPKDCPACAALAAIAPRGDDWTWHVVAVLHGVDQWGRAAIYGIETFSDRHDMADADRWGRELAAKEHPNASLLVIDRHGSYSDGKAFGAKERDIVATESAGSASMTTDNVTYPAFAADTLGETITLTFPNAWRERVDALADRLTYGPNYSRGVVETLADMSRQVRDGYSTLAYDTLVSAERIAARG